LTKSSKYGIKIDRPISLKRGASPTPYLTSASRV